MRSNSLRCAIAVSLLACSEHASFAPVDDVSRADLDAVIDAVYDAGCPGFLVHDLRALNIIEYTPELQSEGASMFRRIKYRDRSALLHEIAHKIGYDHDWSRKLMWPISIDNDPLDIQAAEFVEMTDCRCNPPTVCL
jgi:hypothetical protein